MHSTHRAANGAKLVAGHAAELKDGIQQDAVVQLDQERADGQRGQYFFGDGDYLGIRHHRQITAGNVEVALMWDERADVKYGAGTQQSATEMASSSKKEK